MYYDVKINFLLQFIFTLILFVSFFYLFCKKHKWFGSGFFIGLFWFWWIGLSFRYYNLSWMAPIVAVLIALFYGVVFWLIGKIYVFLSNKNQIMGKLFLTLVFTFGFDYLSPFTFDWLKPEVLFVNSFYSVNKIAVFLLISDFVFCKELKGFAVFLSVLALSFHNPKPPKPPKLNISVATTNVPQNLKWQKSYILLEISNNFKIIKKAIKNKNDVVILPESAFPLFLNKYPFLIDKLKKLSEKITIITGALHLKNNKFYNSTYIFEKGKMTILDKHVLVPFGEYIPLPVFQKEINEIFFNGASDYATSGKFGIFSIKNYKFINAICYEATMSEVYKLTPKYVIALSNDAWFMPSIMPSLQQMIIKIYAKRYGKIVYHSINAFKASSPTL